MIIAVASREYLDRIIRKLEERLRNGPIYIEVKKELVPEFIHKISKGFYLYRPVGEKSETVVYVVSIPENYITIDDNILKYSAYLLDMDVINYLIKKGKIVETGIVESPSILIRYFREWSLSSNRLVLLVSTRLPVKGAALFLRNKLRGIWVDAVNVLLGKEALHALFYYGPYKYVVIDITNINHVI